MQYVAHLFYWMQASKNVVHVLGLSRLDMPSLVQFLTRSSKSYRIAYFSGTGGGLHAELVPILLGGLLGAKVAYSFSKINPSLYRNAIYRVVICRGIGLEAKML